MYNFICVMYLYIVSPEPYQEEQRGGVMIDSSRIIFALDYGSDVLFKQILHV